MKRISSLALILTIMVEICLVNEVQLAAEKAAIAEKLEAQITAKYMERIQELEAQNLTTKPDFPQNDWAKEVEKSN